MPIRFTHTAPTAAAVGINPIGMDETKRQPDKHGLLMRSRLSPMAAIRTTLLPDGKTQAVSIPVCECTEHAQRVYEGGRWVGWTEGRRGPVGGVCGACGGAIPPDALSPKSP
jgi:hypothetical protein